MRSLALVMVAAIMACSTNDVSRLDDPAFHRDCAAPATLACKGLAIITPRQPISPSDMPSGTLLSRHGRVDGFQGPALLQRYVIDGSPPRFHATSNAILSPTLFNGQLTSDGDGLFAFDQTQHSGMHFRAWDTNGAPLTDVLVTNETPGNSGSIAAFSGLAMVHDANYGPTDRLFLYDAHGVLGWSREGGVAASSVSAYGCGFALVASSSGTPSVTTLPLDGRASSQQAASSGTPSPWPYDPHAIAFFSTQIPQFTGELDASVGPCSATLELVFDDGRPPTTHAYDRNCISLFGGDDTARVVTTSFGAVLDFGNGTYVLVDPNGDPIGPSVTIALGGDEPFVQLVAAGDFLAGC